MAERRTLFESRKFCVQRVSLFDERAPRATDIVVHPGAAVILPILDDGRIVMIRNHRITIERELLELPAGTLDPPEPPLECARRELAEETGYTAARLDPLVSFYATPGFCTEQMHAFAATGLTPGAPRHEPGERIRVTPMALEAAIAAVGDGRICDAKTMVTLLYYDRFGQG